MDPTTLVLPEGAPLWAQIVMMVLMAVVTGVLAPYLVRKAQAAQAEKEKLEAERADLNADSAERAMNSQKLLLSQIESFVLMRAASIAERNFPALCASILADGLKRNDAQKVKAALRQWGSELKMETIAFFKDIGIDLVAQVGDHYLDRLIEHAANKVSPFPGRDTAVELLTTKATNWIIERGVEVVRNKYLDGQAAPDRAGSGNNG